MEPKKRLEEEEPKEQFEEEEEPKEQLEEEE